MTVELSDCPTCGATVGPQHPYGVVAPSCREHGVPATVGALCRCMRCCCEPGQGHNHPDFEWWVLYQNSVEEGTPDLLARQNADMETGRRCDPVTNRHSTPHVGCIMR